MDEELFKAVDRYIEDLFAPQDEVMAAVLRETEGAGLPTINIAPAQGQLLHLLARLCQARTMLEIGTLGGYSAIWMARALPADGRLITLEHSTKHAEVARQNITRAGLSDQVEVRIGRALDLLPKLERENAGPFDLVFIDADKQPYTEYFDWAVRLSRPGTLIIADNVIRHGTVIDDKETDPNTLGVRRFNTALAADQRVTATILQTVGVKGHDGLALAVVK